MRAGVMVRKGTSVMGQHSSPSRSGHDMALLPSFFYARVLSFPPGALLSSALFFSSHTRPFFRGPSARTATAIMWPLPCPFYRRMGGMKSDEQKKTLGFRFFSACLCLPKKKRDCFFFVQRQTKRTNGERRQTPDQRTKAGEKKKGDGGKRPVPPNALFWAHRCLCDPFFFPSHAAFARSCVPFRQRIERSSATPFCK